MHTVCTYHGCSLQGEIGEIPGRPYSLPGNPLVAAAEPPGHDLSMLPLSDHGYVSHAVHERPRGREHAASTELRRSYPRRFLQARMAVLLVHLHTCSAPILVCKSLRQAVINDHLSPFDTGIMNDISYSGLGAFRCTGQRQIQYCPAGDSDQVYCRRALQCCHQSTIRS